MELQHSFIILLLSITILSLLLQYYTSSTKKPQGSAAANLPPSLPLLSLLASITVTSWPSIPSLADINHILHRLQSSRGPITSLRLPFCTAIFISDQNLANQLLVSNPSAVSDRFPPSTPFHRHVPDHLGITISPHGDAWRSLRRNLVSGFLTPSSTKHFAATRQRIIENLLETFSTEAAESPAGIVNFGKNSSIAFYRLLVSMCFGRSDLDDKDIVELQETMNRKVSASAALVFFAFLPCLIQKLFSYLLFNKNGHREDKILIDLLKNGQHHHFQSTSCYAGNLLDFELPPAADNNNNNKGRKLREDEILDLCVEFLGASGHNTMIAMEWIMAEIVNNPRVQGKLAEELGQIEGDEMISGSKYLRAVVMEGIRLHSPSPSFMRFAGKGFELGGYSVPKGALVFFNAALMGVDRRVWEAPAEFWPERFLEVGEKGKLMVFGGGRRGCAGSELALFILSYFVGYLVKEFEWRPEEEGDTTVDMTARMEFFMPMKTPLRARIVRRNNTEKATKLS